uniref:Uncharacterized protein n=1 Tax=Virus NIOZ-UU159 TaxID=2763270 RepID=A0A7S9XE94_9VIRU|nr:MAG: hypothetical protein NIOZUU159_00188 [Virus NIOZ-UU159]
MTLTKYLPHILIVVFLLFFAIIGYLVWNYIDKQDNLEAIKPASNNICMSVDDFNRLKKTTIPQTKSDTDTIARDRKVLDDDLYPPLNRGDTRSHTNLANNINRRRMYVNTQETGDTFRLVAYITSTSDKKDSGNNNWKLFARQKDRHFSEFYMIPTDNTNDLKISINNDNIVGYKLRDVYDIPQQLTFNTPLLNKDPYDVVEVPKADLSRSADYI